MITAADPAFGRRLAAGEPAPIVVALSGGGDSLALLLMAKAWADRMDRRLVAMTVDHRLQAEGAHWAAWCAERSWRLGVEHHVLTWTGEKPSAGLPAAARAARHALLADAARAAGAAVILMAHTADDLIEASIMREGGSTTPSPREWSPSPAWPQGRGVFLLRPLLRARRADLRAWLASQGEVWIDDPANLDPRYARARARAAVRPGATTPGVCGDHPVSLAGVTALGGGLTAPRAMFHAPGARRLLSAMLLCASGGSRPARGAAVARLSEALAARARLVATLGGARVEAADDDLLVVRDHGDMRRRGATELALSPGRTVWDGRFEIETPGQGWRVGPLAGLAARLPPAERAALKALPPAARRALPALSDPEGSVSCPILARGGRIVARSLVMDRLSAWSGAIDSEVAIWRVAKADRTS